VICRVGLAIYIFKFMNGRIASLAFELDQEGMLEQLGWTFTPPGGVHGPASK
jgi:hypothetical protein